MLRTIGAMLLFILGLASVALCVLLVVEARSGVEPAIVSAAVLPQPAVSPKVPVPVTTVLAATTQLKPAAFKVADLVVGTERANPGEEVTVTAKVTNTGDVEGIFNSVLALDGLVQSVKKLSIPPGGSQTVSSVVSKETSGVHTINFCQLQGQFEVISVVKPLPTQATNPVTTSNPAAPAGPIVPSLPTGPSCH